MYTFGVYVFVRVVVVCFFLCFLRVRMFFFCVYAFGVYVFVRVVVVVCLFFLCFLTCTHVFFLRVYVWRVCVCARCCC